MSLVTATAVAGPDRRHDGAGHRPRRVRGSVRPAVTLILNEDIDLLEVHLAEIVLAYIERLEARGELDLEAATEFLVLIAALLELKSRLMLPGEEMEGLDLEPQEAVEELLARLLEYRRYRGAAEALHELLAAEQGYRYRSAPLPPELRRVALDAAGAGLRAGAARRRDRAALLRTPPPVDTSHLHRGHRLAGAPARARARAAATAAAASPSTKLSQGADRMTQAVTLFALLELYKSGELTWRQREPFGPIQIQAAEGGR